MAEKSFFMGRYLDVLLGDVPGFACDPEQRIQGQGYFLAESDADPGRVFPVENPGDMEPDMSQEPYRVRFDSNVGLQGLGLAVNIILFNEDTVMMYQGTAEYAIAKGTKGSANEPEADVSFMRTRMPLTIHQKAGLLALLNESVKE